MSWLPKIITLIHHFQIKPQSTDLRHSFKATSFLTFVFIFSQLDGFGGVPSLIWFTYMNDATKKVLVTIVPLFIAVAFLLYRVNSFMTFNAPEFNPQQRRTLFYKDSFMHFTPEQNPKIEVTH